MAGEDPELQSLIQRKAREMLRRVSKPSQPPARRDPMAILKPYLVDRADEVLEAAMSQHPQLARRVVEALAAMIEAGQLSQSITGGQLLWVFRSLGLNVRIETSIRVMQDGRLIPLTERLARGGE
jgi:DNA-binding TFAR19-related protein (PDSD5 family)